MGIYRLTIRTAHHKTQALVNASPQDGKRTAKPILIG